MSQTPSQDRNLLERVGGFVADRSPAVQAARFVGRDRPPVVGEDRRSVWGKMSDWIFDGVLPDSAPKYRGDPTGTTAEMRRRQDKAQKAQGRPYIEKESGKWDRLAADLLIGFADEGELPMAGDPYEDLADDLLVRFAEDTIAGGDAQLPDIENATRILGERAVRQQNAVEEAEGELARMGGGEDLTRRLVELWAEGKTDAEAVDQLRAGGWDFEKADTPLMNRLGEEIEILLDEGELHKAKGLAVARMNLMRGGGAVDANPTPYDALLDSIVDGQTKGLSLRDAFSIGAADTFLSTIRGIGRLTGMGYTTDKDRDILEKMTAASFEEHPLSSMAGSFAGGFADPIFFGLSMCIAKAPITAAQRTRYAEGLARRGIPAATAEEMAKRATLDTIATARLERHFLNKGYSQRLSQAAAGLVWNMSDAVVSNATAEGIIAAGEGQSPVDVLLRSGQGAVMGLAMGVALDRAFRGVSSLSRAFGGTVPKETGAKIDAVADYVANGPEDASAVASGLRAYVTTLRNARDQLGRKLTDDEASVIAKNIGFDLEGLAGRRAVQQRAQQTGREPTPATPRAGGNLSDQTAFLGDAETGKSQGSQGDSGQAGSPEPGTLKQPAAPKKEAVEEYIERSGLNDLGDQQLETLRSRLEAAFDQAEGDDLEALTLVRASIDEVLARRAQKAAEEAGVARPNRPEPTPEQRRRQEADADEWARREAERAERGEPETGLDAEELERRGRRAGITKKSTEPTPAQRRQQEADADAWAKREAEKAEAEIRDRDFPPRVDLDRLSQIEARSADMPDPQGEDLAMAARFQRDNLETVDHRGDDWVRVRVPEADLVNAGTRDVAAEPEVGEYAAMNPATRPPPAVGPLRDGDGALTVVDGQRRVAAARARGETEIEVYLPEWVARERGLIRSGEPEQTWRTPEQVRELAEEMERNARRDPGIVTDRTPAGYGPEPGPEPQGRAPLPTPEEADEATRGLPRPQDPGAERQAKGPRTTERPPPYSREPATGRDTEIIIADADPLPARYAIVEAEDLIPSHDARAGYRVNRYGDPNERPYEDPTEGRNLRAGVGRIADNPQPAFLLTDTPSPLDGPPIVNPDLVVLGGNARAMAQQLAYSRSGEPKARIDRATREAAERFGIDQADLLGFENPVMVRIVDAEAAGEPGELSRALNQGMTAARTPDADAVSRASRLTPAAVRRVSSIIGEDTLGQVFNDPGRTSTLKQALLESGVFTIADYDALTDTRGLLTQAGRRTVENALLASAIPDVRRLAETTPALRNALTRALPALATLRAREPGWVETLGHALDALEEFRDSGARSFEDLLSQTSLMPQPWREDPRALALARAMQRDNPTTLAARLNEYAGVARDRAGGQERMFGDPADAVAFEEIMSRPRGSRAQGGLGFDSMSLTGPGGRPVPRGTSPLQNMIEDPQLGLIAADDNRRMNTADGPVSGVDPGLERQVGVEWVRQPPKTRAGKKVVGRLRADPKGEKIGTRTIAEELSKVLDVFVRQTREQTSARSPAHYAGRGHLIRTRSSAEPAWMFHEQGHAISAIVREANPRFLKDHETQLIELAVWPGSMASRVSAEEGFAEFIRRYITQPAKMAEWEHSAPIETALRSANPRILDAVQDAARAFDVYMARDIPARWRSYAADTKPRPFRPSRVVNRAMTDFVSRGWAAEQAQNSVLRAIRKEGDAPTMRAIREELTDSAADMRRQYQSLNHIHQVVGVALDGPGKGAKGGLRVHATIIPDKLMQTWLDRPRTFTDEASETSWLTQGERDVLEAGGFKLPENPTKHGEVVVLAGKSVREAVAPIAREKWADFETYGQMKATLARVRARAAEGQDFPYQTRGEGVSPAALGKTIRDFERANPEFAGVFDDLEEISNAVLMLQVLSGETRAEDAVTIRNAFEHYLPLTRQGEGGPRSIRSGATAAPTAGIHRSHGSVNPAEPVLMAMARKIEQAVNAYYWNRFALSPIVFAETIQGRKDVPLVAKAAADRVATRLKLDTVKMATVTPEEQSKIVFDFLKAETMAGNGERFNLRPEDFDPLQGGTLSPDDINIVEGFDLWRRKPPKAVNILAPTVNGNRLYFQVLDEDLYRIFASDENVVQAARIAESMFGSVTQSAKNQITQTFEFSIRSLVRDAPSAILFGEDAQALVPGYYHAVGAIARLTGRAPESMSDPELLSRVFRKVTAEDFAKQRSRSMQLLTEGLVPNGWRDMNMLQRTLSGPGVAFRVAAKPIELYQVLTGQRWFANFMESAPREGAYLVAKRKGLSDEAAQLAADTVTGNFSERPLSATAHSLYRTSGFLNPAMQIFGQTARYFSDPDPARTAAKAAVRMGSMATWTAVAWAIKELVTSDEDKARVAELPERERLTHMHVGPFRIPHDYGIMGGISSYVWNMLDRQGGAPGVSSRAMALRVIEGTLPPPMFNPLELLPWSVRAGLETKVNYSFFRQREIEPPFMRYMEPGDRFFDTTPELYKWVGRMTNTSPVRMQYLMRNGFGVQVDNMVRFIDQAEQGLMLDEMVDLPFIAGLFTREPMGWNSRSVQDASELARRYDQTRARLERLYEAGTYDQETLDQLAGVLRKLQPVKDAMLDVQALHDRAKATDEADAEAAKDLRRRMIERAREGLELMSQSEGTR